MKVDIEADAWMVDFSPKLLPHQVFEYKHDAEYCVQGMKIGRVVPLYSMETITEALLLVATEDALLPSS